MEQLQENVSVGATEVNFNLEEGSVQPEFTVIAQPDHEWVFTFGWTVGEELTLYIDTDTDPSNGSLHTMTGTTIPADGDPNIGTWTFDGWQPFDLRPDMYVIVTNGTVTETLLVESLTVVQFDETANTVEGTAPPLRDVGVGVHQPGNDFWMVVTSDNEGTWSAQFPDDFAGVFDIHAMIWDEDGDATQANYPFK